jgi:putative sugar O-methyltransferase
MWLYWNNIKKRDSLHLLKTIEEPELGRGETYEIQGKKMSHDLLQSLDEFYAIYPYLKKKDDLLICELGAGYGRLAYVFLKAIPHITYIVVDLPGSLIISQYYLSTLFSKKDVLTYEASKKLKKLDRKTLSKYKVVCLAPWQLPLIEDKSLDIFINIYSFQEMTMMQIRNYFSLINTKCQGLFYSKQYFISDNPKDSVHIELKSYPVNKKWKIMYERPSTIHQPNFEALYKINT